MNTNTTPAVETHKWRGTGTGWYVWTDENGKVRQSRLCGICGQPKHHENHK